ncbi:MAG: hypothetical protein GAK28_01171 [Luteibacter sp.]|uniref:hypothetical protein n=1 Tax=Luteibacter sp. TaxID=1886636 RepID=UPI001383C928|nr:hypothetical protein [Luteibacter sp.]KAF1008192.1 MAG: hypothetical protein GAK28_01171 [Luteibacter sp.]
MKTRHVGMMLVGLLLAAPASAESWRATGFAEDDRNIVTGALIDAFRFHAEAAATWYLNQLEGNLVSQKTFSQFSHAMVSATYGAFEYTYTKDGVRNTRIYYAMSGRDDPPTGLPSGHTPMANFIAQDSTRIHAYIGANDQSAIRWTEIETDAIPDQHRRDAELKAVRTIERDIRSGVVTRGGRLQAFVSQPMCDSCEHVMHEFERIYGADIQVNYLEGNLSPAYRRFRRLINGFMNTVLVLVQRPSRSNHPTPPSGGACGSIFVQ